MLKYTFVWFLRRTLNNNCKVMSKPYLHVCYCPKQLHKLDLDKKKIETFSMDIGTEACISILDGIHQDMIITNNHVSKRPVSRIYSCQIFWQNFINVNITSNSKLAFMRVSNDILLWLRMSSCYLIARIPSSMLNSSHLDLMY